MRHGLILLATCIALIGPHVAGAMPTDSRPAGPAAALDADIASTYSYYGGTSIGFVTCGSLPESEGCYGSGTLSGLVQPCGILEGVSTTDGNTITRNIYVLDKGDGTSAGVALKVYQRVLTFSNDEYMQVSANFLKSIALPLAAGAELSCAMAANANFIFAGTSASTQAAQISLADDSVQSVGGISPPQPVTQITANGAGFVVVTFGNGAGTGRSGFDIFAPDGAILHHGSGEVFTGNALTGFPLR